MCVCVCVCVEGGTHLAYCPGIPFPHENNINTRGRGKGKSKVHPRTGHEGPEGEDRYSSTLSLTSALDGCGWSTSGPGRFAPGKDPVPIV